MSDQKPIEVSVPAGLHFQSRFFAGTSGLWRRLGNLETSVLADEIRDAEIEHPIYVTSLARSGTTILVEMLERHPDLACHHYSDFPNVWTPYWRNYLLAKTRLQIPQKAERAHRDRIEVNNDSPEAVEEVLWRHFFAAEHQPDHNHILDGGERNSRFDHFYVDHIRKLQLVRRSTRYLAKGNYNIARLGYLLSLFPTARFLIPIRSPLDHVASLVKQHDLFTRAEVKDPRVGRQLALSGHFEFGSGRRQINLGRQEAMREIDLCWESGREVEGWARYWVEVYLHLLKQLDKNSALEQACLLFSYETLCKESESTIDTLLAHCQLDLEGFEGARSEYSDRLSLPSYYAHRFEDSEIELIRSICGPVYADLQERMNKSV